MDSHLIHCQTTLFIFPCKRAVSVHSSICNCWNGLFWRAPTLQRSPSTIAKNGDTTGQRQKPEVPLYHHRPCKCCMFIHWRRSLNTRQTQDKFIDPPTMQHAFDGWTVWLTWANLSSPSFEEVTYSIGYPSLDSIQWSRRIQVEPGVLTTTPHCTSHLVY